MGDTHFSEKKYDLAPFEGKPRTYYMICSTGRSGSTLLCSLLINTGVMGVPTEYLHISAHGKPLITRFGIPVTPTLDLNEYFTAIEKWRTTSNGVFGVKAHINQCLPHFRSGFIKQHFRNLKFVHILRRNVVAQAVSFAIASQTGKWSSHGTAKKTAEYNFESILNYIGLITTQNTVWDQFFAINEISPHIVFYEDLLASPGNIIQGVVDYVGVDAKVSVDLAGATLDKQGTEINRMWEERLKSELRI